MGDQSSPLVLVADDDELMRSLITATLGERGMQTTEASSGEEALKALDDREPDLIILDVLMPGKMPLNMFCNIEDLDIFRIYLLYLRVRVRQFQWILARFRKL